MSDALNVLCGHLGLDMRNDEICIEWMSEAVKYCTLFLKQYPDRDSRKFRSDVDKTMDVHTGAAVRARGDHTYWGFHPNHLKLGQCAHLMSKHSGPVDELVGQTMVSSMLGCLATTMIVCLLSLLGWMALMLLMRTLFADLWVRLCRLRYVPLRRFIECLFNFNPILLDVMDNDLRSLHKTPRPKCDCENHLVKISVLYTRQLPRVADIQPKSKTLIMRMCNIEEMLRMLACKFNECTGELEHKRFLARLEPDQQLEKIRRALQFLGEDCERVNIIIACLDEMTECDEIEENDHANDNETDSTDPVASALLPGPSSALCAMSRRPNARSANIRKVVSTADGMYMRKPYPRGFCLFNRVRPNPSNLQPEQVVKRNRASFLARNTVNAPADESPASPTRAGGRAQSNAIRGGAAPRQQSPRFRNY